MEFKKEKLVRLVSLLVFSLFYDSHLLSLMIWLKGVLKIYSFNASQNLEKTLPVHKTSEPLLKTKEVVLIVTETQVTRFLDLEGLWYFQRIIMSHIGEREFLIQEVMLSWNGTGFSSSHAWQHSLLIHCFFFPFISKQQGKVILYGYWFEFRNYCDMF